MRNELQVFTNDSFGTVRTAVINNEPYFVGKDIADALGYVNTQKAIRTHVQSEDKTVSDLVTVNGTKAVLINESGLYSLIFGSKLPSAKQFKKWVTSDVLPTIRKHGMYATEELLSNPDLAIQTFQALKDERAKNKVLLMEINQQKPLVDFARTVQSTNDNILVRECSKLASNYIGIDIGERKLYQKLRDWKMLLKRRNEPSKLAYKQGILEYVERVIWKNNVPCLAHTTKVTPKGQIYIVSKLIKEYEMAQ